MYPGLAPCFFTVRNNIFKRVFSVYKGVSAKGGLCPGGPLSGCLCPGGLCLGVYVQAASLSRWGASVQGVSWGFSVRGVSVRETPPDREPPNGEEWAVCILLECFLVGSYIVDILKTLVTLIVNFDVIDGVILKFLRLNENTHKSHFQKVLKRFILLCCFNCFLTITTFWLNARNYRHWWSQSFEFPVKKWRSLINPTRHTSKA